jgi:hypothetical protein
MAAWDSTVYNKHFSSLPCFISLFVLVRANLRWLGNDVKFDFEILKFMFYQEKSSGKDGGADVAEKESALVEAGAMDAVLVNTHQVSLCFSFASPLLSGCCSTALTSNYSMIMGF